MSNQESRTTSGVSRLAVAVLVLAAALPVRAAPQIHYWPANGSAADVAGGAQCTFTGASWAAGLTGGQAFDFNSAGAQVACPADVGRFGTSDFVVSFAVKTTQTQGGDGGVDAVALVNRRGVCFHGNFWDIRMWQGRIVFELDDGNGNYTALLGSRFVADGVSWHTVALVRTGNIATLYVDGIFDGSFAAPTGVPADLNTDVDPLLIGRDICENDGYGAQFIGQIDELMISSK